MTEAGNEVLADIVGLHLQTTALARLQYKVSNFGDYHYMSNEGYIYSTNSPNDDTSIPVLALRRKHPLATEEEQNDPTKRTGVFTSGIVSTAQKQTIALFFTGRRHAGENLAEVLQRRAAELTPPMQMCDALSRNLPKLPEKLEVIVGHCLAHARRRFVEVTPNFPEQCRYVLEELGKIYGSDARAREQAMSPEERLRFH